jgi:hypothetical protein
VTAPADAAFSLLGNDESALSSPDTKAGRLQRACLELLQVHERDGAIPTNCRFAFYELEQQGVVPKHYLDEQGRKRARSPAQDINDALTVLRKIGLVPWWWLKDETCELTEWSYAASVYEYVVEKVEYARIDCWGGGLPPLIICEARATAGVLERICGEYLAPITATGGQKIGHIVNEIVPLLKGNDRKVGYIGDCEAAGPADQIEANTRSVIEKYSGRVFTPETWQRIALTRAQVNRSPRLRALVIEKIDHRYKPPRTYEAIECEAVGQVTLENMLRKWLDAQLPEPLADVHEREEEQRAKLRRMLARLRRR